MWLHDVTPIAWRSVESFPRRESLDADTLAP